MKSVKEHALEAIRANITWAVLKDLSAEMMFYAGTKDDARKHRQIERLEYEANLIYRDAMQRHEDLTWNGNELSLFEKYIVSHVGAEALLVDEWMT